MNKWSRPFQDSDASAEPAAPKPMPPAHHYFAFLSYSHGDSSEADWLHGELERFRVPSTLAGRLTANGVVPKRLSPIFRDRHELAASHDLGAEIRQALELSRCLIVLCSPAAAKSKWVNAEVDQFKRLHPEGCIIAAIVGGEPLATDMPGREDEECFPPALVARYNRRGSPTGQKTEPLAADLRGGPVERRTGFLKIVAGILGVGLDDLVQRDHLRRQRRLALFSAASLAGMLVASALAFAAIEARDSARDQRRQAESLIEFMVGDLRDKLQPVGRLDVLDGVGSRVLDYYSKQDTAELSDGALLQRSRALSLMADVAYQRGNLERAEALYRQALAGTGELVRRSPDDPQRIFEHAQNVFWSGEVARFRGDPDGAASGYREYRQLGYRLTALAPDSLKYRIEVLYGEEDVGISLYNKRDYEGATKQFTSVVKPMRDLAALYPSDIRYQKEIGKALSWVAESERAQGHFDTAIATRQRQLSLLEGLLSSNPTDVDLRSQAAVSHVALGVLHGARGESAEAIGNLETAVAEADRLISVEPKNAFWKMSAAMARLQLARQLLAVGRHDDAKAETARGCALSAGLRASGAGMVRARVVQTDCTMLRSRLELPSAPDEALALAQRALASARLERNEDPVTNRYRVAAAYLLLGEVNQRTGQAAAAAKAWNAGLEQIPGGAAERPQDMDTRAELLRRVGRGAEARPLINRLNSIGYRRETS